MRAQLVVLSLIMAPLGSAIVVRKDAEAGPAMSVEEVIKMLQDHPDLLTKNHHPMNVPTYAEVTGADYSLAEKIINDDVAETQRNSDGRCLKFMHIPHTGGSRIDSIGLAQPKGQRPFHSLMGLVFDRIAASEANKTNTTTRAKAKTAGEIFDESHADMQTYYKSFLWEHYHDYLWRVMPEASGACTAPHAPPIEDEVLQSYYNDTSCTTFCVVRDPVDRFISTFKAAFDQLATVDAFGLKGKDCTIEAFETFAHEFLGQQGWILITGKYGMSSAVDCHFVPQRYMVLGGRNGHTEYCDRVLHEDHLEEEFDALMKEYGRKERLSNTAVQFRGNSQRCQFTRHDVSHSIIQKLSENYDIDYKEFNFTNPQ
jgi:hypothetical protein